jgi:protein-tyrosine phosphatase
MLAGILAAHYSTAIMNIDFQELPKTIRLDGVSNVRDIGGWPTWDGGTVKFGRVFRSAALTALTNKDQQRLSEIGLRTICDLRGRRESARAPSRLAILAPKLHALPIEPSIGASLRDLRRSSQFSGENVMDVLRNAYVAYALEWSHRYRAMFALLLQEEPLPLLFHCSAGKDRTGFGAALLLRTLGVPWEAVRADYLATNRLWDGDPVLAAELPPDVAAVMLSAHESWLAAAFDAIRGTYGSFECYLQERIGIDTAARVRLRALLVE